MKTLFLVVLVSVLSSFSFAQSRADYEVVMSKIMKYYNDKNMGEFRQLFADPSELDKNGKWDVEEFYNSVGKIVSYKQTLLHEGLMIFEVNFTGGCWLPSMQVSLTSFSLSRENKVYNFNLLGGWR